MLDGLFYDDVDDGSGHHMGGRADGTIGHLRPAVQGALRRSRQPAGHHRLAEERRRIHDKSVYLHTTNILLALLRNRPAPKRGP